MVGRDGKGGGVPGTHGGVDVPGGIHGCLGGGGEQPLLHLVGEQAGQDAQGGQNPHGNAHAQRDFLGIGKLGVELAEEHALSHLDEGGQGEHAGDEGGHAHHHEEEVARLSRLLESGLIDHPLGGKAVEGGQAADGGGADEEEGAGAGHFLGKAAQLVQVQASGGVLDRTGGEEQQALENGVVHGVEQTGGHAQSGAQADDGDHIPHLGDGVEGQQPLKVVLVEGHGDAHEHGDDTHPGDKVLHEGLVHVLVQAVAQTDDAVHAALGQNARDHQRDGGGGHGVGVGRQGVEGEEEGLGAKAHKEEGEGDENHRGGGRGQQGCNLRQVQGVKLGVEEGDANEHRGGAQRAHHQVLEGALQSTLVVVAEGGEGHGGEGHDLDHDEHVEEVPGQHQAQHGAGQHQKEGVVVDQGVVMAHVEEGVDAGDEHGHHHNEGEEQAQSVHFQAVAEGPAVYRLPVAQPVVDDLALQQHRLDEGENEHQGDEHGEKHHGVAHLGAAPPHQRGDKGP